MAETEKQKDIYILGIESSCDETAASVVKNGREVLSNVISSQIALHTLYGGVVPEIASRKHIEKINQVIEQALADAHVTLEDITANQTDRNGKCCRTHIVNDCLCSNRSDLFNVLHGNNSTHNGKQYDRNDNEFQ